MLEATNHPTLATEEPIVPDIPVVLEATSPRVSHALTQASQPTSSKTATTTHLPPKAQGQKHTRNFFFS